MKSNKRRTFKQIFNKPRSTVKSDCCDSCEGSLIGFKAYCKYAHLGDREATKKLNRAMDKWERAGDTLKERYLAQSIIK